ncbi:MAG TPA: GNAT family N-acetyltransferase [Pyrinomonadaceae bacterium]|jgi:GNAT superfamily N-acetyltransferase|nr:GNAT family N-acetyltransferase [Pyrinomonadaceae bacterium]
MEWINGDYAISTDRARLDFAVIHRFISGESYWGQGRPIEVVRKSVEHSLPFGVYRGGEQVGFARVVTDYATFAWLADVFVLEEHRGRGLSKWLMEVILSHPELQGFRRWVLATKDAHELYRRFGFMDLKRPERWMERPDPKMQESPDYWGTN